MIVASSAVAASGAPTADAAATNTLTVSAGEYAYKLSGNPQPGWVNIQFENGGVEYHMMAVVALKKGVTGARAQEGRPLER